LSENAIIFVIIIGSAFSVAIAVDGAFRNVSPLIVKTAQTMGAKGFDLWFRVIFLAALPALVGGLKQGWSFAWRALMSAEVMSVSVGLGQTLILGRDFADIDRVALVMIMIIVIGVMIDQFIFAAAERHIMKKVGL
jgi:NitT/TauT family transport system permease protein